MNSSSPVCVRPARAGEVDAIHQVIVSAYDIAENSERWTKTQKIAQGWQDFLVMERQGRLVGDVRVGRDRLRYGEKATILKGEVGYVGIVRELHGQGLGTTLLQETVRYMREQGFHISRLGGLNRFYARFGYVPFPRRSYEFPLDPIGAGAGQLIPQVFLQPSREELDAVRAYSPGRDWLERCRLYDIFHAGHTGAYAESRPASPQTGGPDETGMRWVYASGERLQAYAFATMTDTTVEIHDAAFDMENPLAFAAVVKRILWEGVRRGAKNAHGRLAYDDRVESALVAGAVPYVLREVQTAPASNMILMVNLPGFIRAVSPEWTRRLQQADAGSWTGVLELRVQDQTAKLAVTPQGVSLAEGGARPDAGLTVAPRGFLLAALGHRDWHEIAHQVSSDVPSSLARTLSTLLRRGPCGSGPLG